MFQIATVNKTTTKIPAKEKVIGLTKNVQSPLRKNLPSILLILEKPTGKISYQIYGCKKPPANSESTSLT